MGGESFPSSDGGGVRILVLSCFAASGLAQSLRTILENAGPYKFQIIEVPLQDSAGNSLAETIQCHPDLLMPCISGDSLGGAGSLLDALRERFKESPIVAVTDSKDFQSLYELVKLGAADFLAAPLRANDVLPRLLRLQQHVQGRNLIVRRLKETLGLEQFIGESEVLLREIKKIPKVAQCDASVLIGGETGTGKEMVARAVHYLSPRSSRAFLPINCGAIPVDLVENELFGHEAGAFTGAGPAAPGLFHEADGGTLFLDEVDSLPLSAQVKMLRFLQDKEYRPLGSRKACKADVRVIAASNAPFEEAIRCGKFRSDLFYRLNVISLSLPSLRQRVEDIPLLARHLVVKYSREYAKPVLEMSASAVRKLLSYDWPGNVRQLENVIAGAIVLSEDSILQADDIRLPVTAPAVCDHSFKTLKAQAVAQFEASYIRRLLIENSGNITRAAGAAKKHRRAFWQLMQKHRITLDSATTAADASGHLPA
jgi:two-component system response regulator GlrR